MSKVKDAMCYGEFDVTQDRDKYIGGSDLPAVLGISKFTSRWQLLLEKAGLAERPFTGNRYTGYGHMIEPKIRDYLNERFQTNFVPNRVIDGDIRYHADGFDGKCVLEVKSTSDIHAGADQYKSYLVQILKGMEVNGVEHGILAVYHRPEDLSPEFDPERLQIFPIELSMYGHMLDYINVQLDRFRSDLERLKANPLLSEQDFLTCGGSLITLANKVVQFETQLAAMKEVEAQLKEAKQALYFEMVKHDVKSWVTPNGTRISRVDEVPPGTKTVTELDLEALKKEYPTAYQRCLRKMEKQTNGKKGYVRITVK